MDRSSSLERMHAGVEYVGYVLAVCRRIHHQVDDVPEPHVGDSHDRGVGTRDRAENAVQPRQIDGLTPNFGEIAASALYTKSPAIDRAEVFCSEPAVVDLWIYKAVLG